MTDHDTWLGGLDASLDEVDVDADVAPELARCISMLQAATKANIRCADALVAGRIVELYAALDVGTRLNASYADGEIPEVDMLRLQAMFPAEGAIPLPKLAELFGVYRRYARTMTRRDIRRQVGGQWAWTDVRHLCLGGSGPDPSDDWND
jgi:hypothetical protein